MNRNATKHGSGASASHGNEQARLAEAPGFPHQNPSGYAALDDEPRFDPRRHFAFTQPERTWTLADFGYDKVTIAASPSPVAVAGPFRVLSEEGAETARTIALRLKELSWQSDRTASYLTGGVYRSRFLRDLFTSPELAAFLSSVAGTALAPHSMPSQQLYVNYAPEDITRHVDTWHTDSIGFDIVLMVTDPKAIKGGLFQFFRGTREAAARQLAAPVAGLIKGSSVELSSDQIESMPFPGPGYALFQQGNLVLHRATRLMEKGERITMVPGFVARDTRFADPTNVGSIVNWGEPGIPAELARHKAWFAHGRLEAVMSDLSMDATPREAAMALRHAIADASSLADLLEGAGGAETAS